MKILFSFFFFLFFSSLSAQNTKKEQIAVVKPVTSISNADSLDSPLKKSVNFIEGTIPSPESQGFIKTVVNGKDVYIKEDTSIFIQYQPN